MTSQTEEELRLEEDRQRKQNWKRWGPYLSERQWGTVREDYSENGNCWDYFTHDHARSRAYRWGEDGLLGICDRQARLCFSLALWNGKDGILKERLFGLTGPEGNHGEDCKENYYYVDSTPTHSYMKALYKYPQAEYPYSRLTSSGRGILDRELELEDTGVFDERRYWDVVAEYAKASPDDVLMKTTVVNMGPEAATLHLIPTLWFRNTWSWGCTHEGCTLKPRLVLEAGGRIRTSHETLPEMAWTPGPAPDGTAPKLLFTENETNMQRLFGLDDCQGFFKDAFHSYIIEGDLSAVNPKQRGTKAAAVYVLSVPAGGEAVIVSRLSPIDGSASDVSLREDFEEIFRRRKLEADQFYDKVLPNGISPEERNVARQACAGIHWSKQFYHYIVKDWLHGDLSQPVPPDARKRGRNSDWGHLFNRDVISMPDKWEYPWYASWDLAFHMIPFTITDPDFAKQQLLLFLREWYMHPNGQIPAYEFAFEDVNPPVHAWAVLTVYKSSGPRGQRDNLFLARCFQKLLLNFTWWVNRKDPQGKNIFSGGFLGLDNIGIFDRSKPLPFPGQLEQADGTAWMAFNCSVMLNIALYLAEQDPTYEDMASKFFEHFILIVDAMSNAGQGGGLWDEQDGFYYDYIRCPDGHSEPLRIRSLVGLVPLFACLVLEESRLRKLEGFYKRTRWFMNERQDLFTKITYMRSSEDGSGRLLLAVPTKDQFLKLLSYLLDEEEFLSPFGIRSLSKKHKDHPFSMRMGDEDLYVHYTPGESETFLFGGNSNWRGPIWICMNYLIISVLHRYHYFYGDHLRVECPTGSGHMMTLAEISDELATRVIRLFLPSESGNRPCHGENRLYAEDPAWKDLVLFYEYFHGDTGRGCGASHQTGWTALVVNLLALRLRQQL